MPRHEMQYASVFVQNMQQRQRTNATNAIKTVRLTISACI